MEGSTRGGKMKKYEIIYPLDDDTIVPIKISDVVAFSCYGFEPAVKNPIIVMTISLEDSMLSSNKYTQEQAEQVLDSFKGNMFMTWNDSGALYGIRYSSIIDINTDEGCVAYLQSGAIQILRSVPPEAEITRYLKWKEAQGEQ